MTQTNTIWFSKEEATEKMGKKVKLTKPFPTEQLNSTDRWGKFVEIVPPDHPHANPNQTGYGLLIEWNAFGFKFPSGLNKLIEGRKDLFSKDEHENYLQEI